MSVTRFVVVAVLAFVATFGASIIPHPYNFVGIAAGLVLVAVGVILSDRENGFLAAPMALAMRAFAWAIGGGTGIIAAYVAGFFV